MKELSAKLCYGPIGRDESYYSLYLIIVVKR